MKIYFCCTRVGWRCWMTKIVCFRWRRQDGLWSQKNVFSEVEFYEFWAQPKSARRNQHPAQNNHESFGKVFLHAQEIRAKVGWMVAWRKSFFFLAIDSLSPESERARENFSTWIIFSVFFLLIFHHQHHHLTRDAELTQTLAHTASLC